MAKMLLNTPAFDCDPFSSAYIGLNKVFFIVPLAEFILCLFRLDSKQDPVLNAFGLNVGATE